MKCPFCKNSSLASRIIYKDNLVMSFPTNIPITVGHILVSPVRHISKIDDLSSDELIALRDFIVKAKKALKIAFDAEGFNIAWNEGHAAGQNVDHLHIHVVPRKKGDTGIYEYEPRKFLYRPGTRNESPEKELIEIAGMVKGKLK